MIIEVETQSKLIKKIKRGKNHAKLHILEILSENNFLFILNQKIFSNLNT
jgi:hypothetical protein